MVFSCNAVEKLLRRIKISDTMRCIWILLVLMWVLMHIVIAAIKSLSHLPWKYMSGFMKTERCIFCLLRSWQRKNVKSFNLSFYVAHFIQRSSLLVNFTFINQVMYILDGACTRIGQVIAFCRDYNFR